MTPIEITKENRAWDRFRAFHTVHRYDHNTVQFETGELVFYYDSRRPDLRGERVFEDIGVAIFKLGEIKYKLKTPDGKPVCKTWLEQARGYYTPTFLLDYKHRRMVFMDSDAYHLDRNPPLPDLLKNAGAWIVNKDAPPTGGADVRLSNLEKFTKEKKQWMEGVEGGCKAYYNNDETMRGYYSYRGDNVHINASNIIRAAYMAGLPPAEAIMGLEPRNMACIAEYGYKKIRENVTQVPYLTFE